MTKFEAWHEEVADIPQQHPDGSWFDLETGLSYDPSIDYTFKSQSTLSSNALDARIAANKFGGKALTGSTKQKNWAETIRASVLATVPPDQARLICSASSLTGKSKFWIDNRDVSPAKIAEFIKVLIFAVRGANSASRAGNTVDPDLIAQINRANTGDMTAFEKAGVK